jgi:hypothetical protein
MSITTVVVASLHNPDRLGRRVLVLGLHEEIYRGIWTPLSASRLRPRGISILTGVAHDNVPPIPHSSQHICRTRSAEHPDLVAGSAICRDQHDGAQPGDAEAAANAELAQLRLDALPQIAETAGVNILSQ